MTGSPFAVWDAAEPRELESWIRRWRSWPRREVFAHPNYMRLFVDEGSRALCAAYRSAEGCVLYPFLLRDLAAEPFYRAAPSRVFDIVTPYGYGGPFQWGAEDRNALATRFWDAFSGWVAEQPVISEFVRFHLFQGEVLDYPGEREQMLLNVVRDLCLGDAELWMDYEHKVRKNVKRARRAGVRVEIDTSGDALEQFLTIYRGTMDRRDAADAYYFPRRFFEVMRAGLLGQFAYFHALLDGKIVSTELVLLSEDTAYSFLGGTDARSFAARPNDLLKHEIIAWAKRNGKRRYVLGGGYRPDDGIFKYKRSFAPEGCVPFYVGRRVFDLDLYRTLVEKKCRWAQERGGEWEPRPGYFPEYRA